MFHRYGKSLYVAKQIEKEPVSIPQVMKRERMEFSDGAIGIVAPVYGHKLPSMVREFLVKGSFHTDYFYMVLTYGNRHGGAAELAQSLCRRCGIEPAYINVLQMADNWLPSFDMEEEKRLDKKTEEHLAAILEDIRQRKRGISPVTDADRRAHLQFLEGMARMPEDTWQHLIRVTDACTGCGICEKVCPSGSIRVEGGRAVHHSGNCQTCLACVHACPGKALGLSIPEKNPGARYRNSHISLQEIIEANHQENQ